MNTIEFANSETAGDAKRLLNSGPLFKYKMTKDGSVLFFGSKIGETVARKTLRGLGIRGYR